MEKDLAATYKLLGLAPGANIHKVEFAYKKLKSRCDPMRFNSDSVEEDQARQITLRLDAAYKQLSDALTLLRLPKG